MYSNEIFRNSKKRSKFSLKNIFSVTNKYYRDDNAALIKIKIIKILGCSLYIYCVTKIQTYWEKEFKKYFKNNNVSEKIKLLKEGLDDISQEYIDKYMSLIPYWNKCVKDNTKIQTDYDLKLMTKYRSEKFVQPFNYILKYAPFIFLNKQGLIDLPADTIEKLNRKDIIDAGGFNGDTAVMFAEYLPKSKIYIYEPLIENIKTINVIVREGNYKDRIIPIQKGLGNEVGIRDFSFNSQNQAEIVSLDIDYKGDNLGLIKIDTEGFETQIIQGATELIKKYKPVLDIAIYHRPEDFFELKNKLLAINHDYKFMIRRSEQMIPTADLVLIAY